jgi:quinol-cytochrome oxidoreductase complex cytochrome b subunit
VTPPSPLADLAATLDRRLGRSADRPSVWPTSFGAMISHVIVVAFLVLVVTGIFLTFFYRPSTAPVTYSGSSALYDGATLPAAFASTVRIGSDVPGGLFVKRVHAAASHLFLAALVVHLLRVMATGQFRRPRLGTHLLGIALLLLGIGFAYTGELMPFTLKASSSLRIGEAVLASIPFLGGPLASVVVGPELPSDQILVGAWVLHVVVLPVSFVALTVWHLRLVHRRTPTIYRRQDVDVTRYAVGRPLWPDAIARFALLTAGIVALLSVSSALVPWADSELAGPFIPAEATNSVHPSWPLFFTTGAMRVLPAIDLTFLGARITNVLVAGVVLPGLLIGMLAIYPFLERLLLRDEGEHHTVDGLLDVPLRAGAVGAFTGAGLVLTLSAGVDALSFWLGTPVETVVLVFRLALVIVPVLAAVIMVKAAHTRARARAIAAAVGSSPAEGVR